MTQTFYTYGDTNEPAVPTQLIPIQHEIAELFAMLHRLTEAVEQINRILEDRQKEN